MLHVDIGNCKRGFERAHLAGPVVTGQKFEPVFAGRERKAGVVFNAAATQLAGVAFVSLTWMPSRTVATMQPAVQDLADEVEFVIVSAPFLATVISDPGIFTDTGTKYLSRMSRK